jgi:hypothetical protein
MPKLSAAILRAAVLAVLALGLSMPAQAGSFGFGGDNRFDPDDENPDNIPELAICQTDYQVRRAFAADGYERIYLGGEMSDKRVQVKASREGHTYLFNYNRCSTQILDIQRIK